MTEIIDMEIGDVHTVSLGASPSVKEADALWMTIMDTCHSDK